MALLRGSVGMEDVNVDVTAAEVPDALSVLSSEADVSDDVHPIS